ncbi:Integral membrane protein [Apiospora phragmitis]|uniref:Integral membrane protein n=1 Tax=Apiospora phragmitis TaxID=2905665 RepID=A0ABR1VY83_9PEZI
MVALAITRASKINGAAGVDVPWEFFWQFMEASVAVLMGSLTVFRTLLSSKTGSSDERGRPVAAPPGGPWPHARPAYYVFSSLGRRKRRADAADLEATKNGGIPEVPGATMTGLRTFIRRHDRGTTYR